MQGKSVFFFNGNEMEIVNSHKYLGYTLTTKLSSNSACEEYASKAKGKILDLMKTMWSLGSLNTTVFFQLFKPMLLMLQKFGTHPDSVLLSQLICLHTRAC